MLRSQSISNLNDQRKSRSSFFSGLRSKKISSSDLRGDVKRGNEGTTNPISSSCASGYSKDIRDGSITISGPRPLSTSQSINHLSLKYQNEKTSHPTYSARLRENKENIEILRGKSSVPNLNFARNRSPTKAENSEKAIERPMGSKDSKTKTPRNNEALRVLANESSMTHSQSHRSSLFLGSILSRTTTSLSIHDDNKDNRRHSMRPSPRESTYDISPDTIHTTDSLMDQASIQIYDFENSMDSLGIDVSDNIDDTSGSIDEDDKTETGDIIPEGKITDKSLSESKITDKTVSDGKLSGKEGPIDKDFSSLLDYSIRKIHRTTNLYNIKEFRKLMNVSIDEDDMLPLINRKSLQFESLECQKLESLLNHSDPIVDDNFSSTLTLVENVYFLTTTSETKSNFPFEDDIDYCQLFKEESYDVESDETINSD